MGGHFHYSISAKANSGYTYLGVASGNLSGTMPNSDYGVYLKFGSNYTINFNGNGTTSGSTASQSRVYSDGTKALTANGFSRIGYTFTGWNTAANGSDTSYSNGQWVNNLTSTVNGIVTLYAQWKANAYTLTINPNGGTLNVSDSSIINTFAPLEFDVMSKEGGVRIINGGIELIQLIENIKNIKLPYVPPHS